MNKKSKDVEMYVVFHSRDRVFMVTHEDVPRTTTLAGEATVYDLANARADIDSASSEDRPFLTAIELIEASTMSLAPSAEAGVQGELLAGDAGAVSSTEPQSGLRLESPVEAKMTALALSEHHATLSSLAKKLREAGQEREAAVLDANAKLVKERLLPQLETQVVLPFGYVDVGKAIHDRVAGRVRSQLAQAVRRNAPLIAGELDEDREMRIQENLADFEVLVGSVAELVSAVVTPAIVGAASRGEMAGRHARETTADTLALEALEAASHV
jgi:hypothetical protein